MSGATGRFAPGLQRTVGSDRARGVSALMALLFAALAFAIVTTVHSAASAEEYPQRPIKIIVPFSPGGSTDALARHVKREIDEQNLLPHPLVIVNLEGAGSVVGSRRAKNAEPDGYTLMVLNEAIVTSKYWGTVPYGPEAFEAIAATGEAGTVLTVREDCEYADLGEMLKTAKEHPRTVTAAVALGTPSHFAALGAQAALPGAELVHAQFGGGAHRFAALKGGHVDLTTFSTDEFLRFRDEGLRGLAYLGTERHPSIADVPTALEQGYDVQRSISLYWWAPKGTPANRLKVIGDVLEKAMQGETLQKRLRANSVDPVFLRGEALEAKLQKVEADIQSVDPRRQVQLPNVALWTVVVIGGLTLWSFLERKPAPSPPPPNASVAHKNADADADDGASPAAEADVDDGPGIAERPAPQLGRAWAALVLTAAFVTMLSMSFFPLWMSIAAFMLSCGAILGGFHSRELSAALLLLTATLSFGFHYLLTYVFVVDF